MRAVTSACRRGRAGLLGSMKRERVEEGGEVGVEEEGEEGTDEEER